MVLFYVVELPMTRSKRDHLLLRRYVHKDQLISKRRIQASINRQKRIFVSIDFLEKAQSKLAIEF